MDLKNLTVQGVTEVLIADGNEFNRTILRTMREKMGNYCEEAASGLKAIEMTPQLQFRNKHWTAFLRNYQTALHCFPFECPHHSSVWRSDRVGR